MRETRPPAPPALARLLLSWLLPGEHEDAVLGDLAEEFEKRCRQNRPRAFARVWYWRQVLHLDVLRLRREVGGLDRRKEEGYDARGVILVENVMRDARHAVRTLGRDLGFTAGVVLLLALGIGANVGVLSIVNSVILRPLPYHDSDRLVAIRELVPQLSEGSLPVNQRHFVEWQACRCFDGIALSSNYSEVNITGAGEPVRVRLSRVTPNVFELLGVETQFGRTFLPEDGQAGENRVVVISDGLWRRRFAESPSIVGTRIGLDGVDAVVVGVLPPGFRHFDRSRVAPNGEVDVYAPWFVAPAAEVGWLGNFNYEALGRLREGVSLEAARQELDGIQAGITERFDPQFSSFELRAQLIPLRESLTGESRAGLVLLLVAVGAALLVACLNIANLMLVRATTRSREAALRVTLGAPRAAIFRGVLIESAMLALMGSAAGVAIAAGFLRVFAVIAPARLPRADEVTLDSTVLFVGLAFAVVATLTFGLLPAIRMTSVDPQTTLRAGGRSVTGPRSPLGEGLVSLEVALSASLLVTAGLLAMSFVRLQGVDRGYNASDVLTAEISLPTVRYEGRGGTDPDESREQFWNTLVERLGSSPGVVAVGVTSMLPLRGDNWGDIAVAEGDGGAPSQTQPEMQYRWVSPDYWRAMGIPTLAGRSFAAADRPAQVAVVSERVARLLWPDDRVVGRRFYRSNPDDLYEVVGVVPDVHAVNLSDDPVPLVYLPLWLPGARVTSVAIRTVGEPSAAAATLRDVVASIDPQLAVSDVQTMEQIDNDVLGERRFQLILISVFALASLLVAVVGTYSVLAYTVSGRMHEIAIRLSLGAEPAQVKAMVIGQGLRSVLVGLGLGVAGALALGHSLSGFMFSVSPTDPAPFVVVIFVTLSAATVACWIPAQRAARASSLDALRCE